MVEQRGRKGKGERKRNERWRKLLCLVCKREKKGKRILMWVHWTNILFLLIYFKFGRYEKWQPIGKPFLPFSFPSWISIQPNKEMVFISFLLFLFLPSSLQPNIVKKRIFFLLYFFFLFLLQNKKGKKSHEHTSHYFFAFYFGKNQIQITSPKFAQLLF